MTEFSRDACVAVLPFARRREGNNVTIGDPARGVFVEIPAEGLEILDALAAGATVAEVALDYERAHGETPDMEDFLTAMVSIGLVAAPDASPDASEPSDSRPPASSDSGRIAPGLSFRVFAAVLMAGLALLAGAGIALVAADPGLIPGPTVLVFHRHLALLGAALFAVGMAGIAVHELGHLLAARAAGVPARIGVGHRLWIIVAETDMSGIWLASRPRRYIAFLAGPLIDAASSAVLLGILWAARHGWLAISPATTRFLGAVLWSYLLRLLWECFVFVRTDLYYVISTALGCKRLLADTEDLLRNQLARVRTSIRTVDQSSIPPRELRAVRSYSIVWLAGRALAVWSLLFVTLPVLAGYATGLVRVLAGTRTNYSAADVAVLATLGLGVPLAGLFLWIRSLYRGAMQRSTT
jgi:putative peptide zinc metalloprotease protein